MQIIAAVPKQLLDPIVRLMKKANQSYRNTGEYYKAVRSEVPDALMPLFKKHTRNGYINDPLFDALEAEVKRLDPGNPVLKDTGVAPKRNKIKLPFAMPSLSKIKGQAAVESWIAANPGPYCVSDKIDGNSIGTQYKGTKRLAFTKGRGGVAGDITFMADELNLPNIKADLQIRGEVVMPVATFQREWSEHYQNPRNMMAGILNKNDLHEGLQHSRTYFYEVISPRGVPSAGLTMLKAKGFRVVPFKVYPKLSYALLLKILDDRRAKVTYEMDGLVIVQDRKNPVNTADNPTFACAFKSDEADETAVTTVIAVEWNTTRQGYLFPRLVIEPVRLKGVTVNYASGKSAAFIKASGLGVGAKIRIARSGDVIPDIREVLKRVKPDFPSKAKQPWEWIGENIRLLDHANDSGSNATITIKNIEFFFTTMGVERFKYATISKFVDAGIKSVASILKLGKAQFLRVPGTSVKVLEPVWQQIQEQINDCELHTLMYASGKFGRALGTRRFAAVLKAIPDVLEWNTGKSSLVGAVSAIYGFDSIMAEQFAAGLPAFKTWLKTVPSITYTLPKRTQVKSKLLLGQRVVMTGFRDAAAARLISEHSGEVIEAIGKSTVLLAKDPNGTGAKLSAARAAGITIMTLPQFLKKFKLERAYESLSAT